MARHKASARLLGLVAILLAALMTACTSSTNPGTDSSGDAQKLVVGATLEPASMDMTTSDGAGTPQALLYNVYETLVKIDNSGNIKPLLARSWEVSPDRKTYTFTLQGRAKFASGGPVNADAVVESFDRIRNAKDTLANLKNQMSVVTDVVAVDDSTVKVTLSRPSNNWLYWIAGPAGIVIDPSGMDALATKPMGSGPFKFGEWRKGESLTFERNDDYWGTPARFAEAQFRYFTDANALTAAMLAGDIDIISDLTTPEAVDQFSDTSKYQVLEGTTNGEVVLGFNHDNKALSDLKVRQAINYAINREALLTTVWNGKGTLIGSMVPPTDPWYEDLSDTYPFDPAKAKQLLKEAGYESGLTLRLRIPTLPYAPPAATFVASQLADVGVTVKVEELEFAAWIDSVFSKGDYDMTIVAHAEPRDIVKWADPAYYWHYDNPEFQKLIAQADAAPEAENVRLMKQAAKLLADDAVADFLFLFPNLVVTTADISGVNSNSTSSSFDLTSIASANG